VDIADRMKPRLVCLSSCSGIGIGICRSGGAGAGTGSDSSPGLVLSPGDVLIRGSDGSGTGSSPGLLLIAPLGPGNVAYPEPTVRHGGWGRSHSITPHLAL